MKITTSFKNFEHTPAIDIRITEKTHSLKKFFEGNLDVQWICSIDDRGEHVSEIKIHGPSFDYFASASSDNLYKTFDQAIDKIKKQVYKKKDKWKTKGNKLKQKSAKELLYDGIVLGEENRHFEDEDAA